MKKIISNGISDFKILIENNYYYIDKTSFIDEVGKNTGKTLLFTRPRRFGKTLNMSMLKYFFDIRESFENRKLFTGLNIENLPIMDEQGKYPVIFISFKDIKQKNKDNFLEATKILIANLFKEYRDIVKHLDEFDYPIFMKYATQNSSYEELKLSLKFLSDVLYRYYKKEVVLLIDEYDTPIVSSYENGYYNDAMDLFRGIYSACLKDNTSLKIGIMTGILRIAKEGIFSGLNNLAVYTILDNEYSKYFGLTEKEVKEALDYYELEYNLDKVKLWYDGYKMGNSEVYNPWSILNYLSRKEIEAYWVNTSNNYFINDLLKNASTSLFDELKSVFNNESIEKIIDKHSNLDLLTNPQEVWQLLLYSGYLTVDEKLDIDLYKLKIPNEEIKSFFKKSFIDKFLGNTSSFKKMIDSLISENIVDYEKYLEDILTISMSFYDSDKNEEKFYHNLILGMILSLDGNYHVSSNRESGNGRYDLKIEPKIKNKTGYIFEFKIANSENKLEEKAKEGLEQIKIKNYALEMKKNKVKNILGLGIAFYKKRVKIVYEKL